MVLNHWIPQQLRSAVNLSVHIGTLSMIVRGCAIDSSLGFLRLGPGTVGRRLHTVCASVSHADGNIAVYKFVSIC